MQASKVRRSKTGLASRRNCAASRLRAAAKRRNQPPETTQEDTRHTVKFNSGLDLWTLDSAAACRAGAIVLLVGFWFDGGLFKLATGATFWILLELGQLPECRYRP